MPLGRDRSECEEVNGARAQPAVAEDAAEVDKDAAAADAASGYDGWDILFCGARRFTLVGANPVHSWGDLKNGYVFARIARGQGSVDVLADLDFLDSDQLEEPASFLLARQLLQPNHGAGTVHLVYAAQMPSLWATLRPRSWMAWAPLLLALLAWLWRRMQRFGPQLAAARERAPFAARAHRRQRRARVPLRLRAPAVRRRAQGLPRATAPPRSAGRRAAGRTAD